MALEQPRDRSRAELFPPPLWAKNREPCGESENRAVETRERECNSGETEGQTVDAAAVVLGATAEDSPFCDMTGEKLVGRYVSVDSTEQGAPNRALVSQRCAGGRGSRQAGGHGEKNGRQRQRVARNQGLNVIACGG